MKDGLPALGDAARLRDRSLITTILLIMIAVMIARDILRASMEHRRAGSLRRDAAFAVVQQELARPGEKPENRANPFDLRFPRCHAV